MQCLMMLLVLAPAGITGGQNMTASKVVTVKTVAISTAINKNAGTVVSFSGGPACLPNEPCGSGKP